MTAARSRPATAFTLIGLRSLPRRLSLARSLARALTLPLTLSLALPLTLSLTLALSLTLTLPVALPLRLPRGSLPGLGDFLPSLLQLGRRRLGLLRSGALLRPLLKRTACLAQRLLRRGRVALAQSLGGA